MICVCSPVPMSAMAFYLQDGVCALYHIKPPHQVRGFSFASTAHHHGCPFFRFGKTAHHFHHFFLFGKFGAPASRHPRKRQTSTTRDYQFIILGFLFYHPRSSHTPPPSTTRPARSPSHWSPTSTSPPSPTSSGPPTATPSWCLVRLDPGNGIYNRKFSKIHRTPAFSIFEKKLQINPRFF